MRFLFKTRYEQDIELFQRSLTDHGFVQSAGDFVRSERFLLRRSRLFGGIGRRGKGVELLA